MIIESEIVEDNVQMRKSYNISTVVDSRVVYGSTSKDVSSIAQTFYVFERKFIWRCSYIVPFILFAFMVSMIVL